MKNQLLASLAVIIVLTAISVNVGNASSQASLTLQSSGVVQARTGSTTFNGIWLFQPDLTTAMLQSCVANQIFNIFLSVGYPNPSQYPSLTGIVPSTETGFHPTVSQISDDLALLASVDSRLKLWAWFGTYGYSGGNEGHQYGQVDISTSGNRNALIAVLVSLAHDYGFYGVQDDTEDYTTNSLTSSGQWGSWQVAFWNAEATACHAVGLKFAPFLEAGWSNFNTVYVPQFTGMDYLIISAMMGQTQSFWTTQIAEFLTHTTLPVIIDLEEDHSGDITTQISWVDALPASSYSNIVGFSLYCWNGLVGQSSDWSSWSSWTTKNLSPSGY